MVEKLHYLLTKVMTLLLQAVVFSLQLATSPGVLIRPSAHPLTLLYN